MVAALLAREDLERLPRRADGAEALLRRDERDLGVALAVNQQEGAPDSLHHPVEPEALEPLQRRVPRGHAENPEQVLPGHGQRGRLAARDPIQPLLPDRVVIPLRSPRDAGGEARLERGRSEEHTSELQSPCNLVCRLLLEKKKKKYASVQ